MTVLAAPTATAAFAQKLHSPGVINSRRTSIRRKSSDSGGGGVVVEGVVGAAVLVEIDRRSRS